MASVSQASKFDTPSKNTGVDIDNYGTPSSASHFFNSMLSVTQNAMSSLTGGLRAHTEEYHTRKRSLSDSDMLHGYEESNETMRPRSKTSVGEIEEEREEDDEVPYSAVSAVKIAPLRSAISTLGKGELSLEQLGLRPENAAVEKEDDSTSVRSTSSKPTSNSSSEKSPVVAGNPPPMMTDNGTTGNINSTQLSEFSQGGILAVPTMSRSKSRASSLISRHRRRRSHSQSQSEVFDDDEDSTIHSNSHSHHHHHHHQPQHNLIIGFAYASKKRNKDFHRLFKSVQNDDYLLDDFSCALSKDILVHGRMYVSERHVCFNSNILGWVTNLIIGFDEIVALEKKNTAGLFPNGIIIQTLHARHSFASFVSRDSTIDFLISIWKKTSPHNPRVDADGNGMMLNSSDEATEIEDDDDDLDEEEEGQDEAVEDGYNEALSDSELEELERDEDEGASLGSFGSSDEEDVEPVIVKAAVAENNKKPNIIVSDTIGKNTISATNVPANKWPVSNLGPETHAPTDVDYDPEANGEKLLLAETLPAPLGVVANLLFGDDGSWQRKFILDSKNINVSSIPAFQVDSEDNSKKSRNYDFVKLLNGPVGPKQTKCVCKDVIEEWNLNKSIRVVTTTHTPDVPSGASFVTKTRYGLSWSNDNQTKLVLSYWMEWSGKSWIKGAIERGSQDGQLAFAKSLVQEIKNTIAQARAKPTRKVSVKEKPKKIKPKAVRPKRPEAAALPTANLFSEWPLVKSISGILCLQPVSSIALPLYAWIMFFVIACFTLLSLTSRTPTIRLEGSERLRQMMLEEEYEMWKWIDGRIGKSGTLVDDLLSASTNNNVKSSSDYARQNLEESIRITEQRLSMLKQKLNI